MAYHGYSSNQGNKPKGRKVMKSPSYNPGSMGAKQKTGHGGGTKLSYYGKMEPPTQYPGRYPR